MQLQSNVQQGAKVLKAAADLTGLEGRLVIINSSNKFALAGANPTAQLYVLIEGDVADAEVSAEPIQPGKRYRVRSGAVNWALGAFVTSGANGLAAAATPASDTVIKTIAGVVEEANDLSGGSNTGAVLILGMNQLVQRSAAP